ncbi:MAG: threonine dehydratase [Chloroflexi bacterium]|nr:MAG: threonine dehydratase [Chloroflexota bacterium]
MPESNPSLVPPTLTDVRDAAANIAAHMPTPTPLVYSPGLSERLDAHVSLKLETANPINVFKLRGGINLISQLPPADRTAGVVVASTGNHGQSIAFAAQRFGVPAHIFAPQDANPDKVTSMRRLGAQVTLSGARFDDARRAAGEFAAERGLRYIHTSDEPLLIAGVGTAALEVLETQQPETDIAIVPLGGGSGACGWITVRDGLDHPARVWAVQSAQAPAVHDSWRAGKPLERPNTTIAEGLATGSAFAFPLRILATLDDFLLVHDTEIEEAVRALLDLAHVLAEPSGAASAAAALQETNTPQARLRGKHVVLVVSGANITRDQLRAII